MRLMRFQSPRFMRKQSLSAALFTLLFSMLSVLAVFYIPRPPSRLDSIGLAAMGSMNFTIWLVSGWNLIQDVERGYSPSKCSLAAMILLLSVLPMGVIGIAVFSLIF